jgi:HD-GYP domain-containing protein (c-di-GMP phosphodiesterase class II)
MRLTATARAVGLRLARDIEAPDPHLMPVLRANAVVTERYAAALSAIGVRAVWVHDDFSDGIQPVELIGPRLRREAAQTVSRALDAASAAFHANAAMPPEALVSLGDVVRKIAASVARNAGAAVAQTDLATADAYTHQHSVDVCALGLLLARMLFARHGWEDDRGRPRFDHTPRRLQLLGTGLLLHDIGKLALPPEILNKPGPLDDEELAAVREHPAAGVQMLAGDSWSPVVRAVVREHHERWDGTGYPQKLAGRRIHQLARIAAVADVYDAVTSERPYKAAQPPAAGWAVIEAGAGTAFDPAVVEVFSEVVVPYPVGSEVRSVDGALGVVARIDPADARRPWVRFRDGERQICADELAAA